MLAKVVFIPRRTLLIKVEECLERWRLEKTNKQVCYEIESWVRGGLWENETSYDFIKITRTQTQTMAHSAFQITKVVRAQRSDLRVEIVARSEYWNINLSWRRPFHLELLPAHREQGLSLCPFSESRILVLKVNQRTNLGNPRKLKRTSRIWAIHREKII